MRPLKTEIIPVVIGALGLIKKELEKHSLKIPGAINIIEVRKKQGLAGYIFGQNDKKYLQRSIEYWIYAKISFLKK